MTGTILLFTPPHWVYFCCLQLCHGLILPYHYPLHSHLHGCFPHQHPPPHLSLALLNSKQNQIKLILHFKQLLVRDFRSILDCNLDSQHVEKAGEKKSPIYLHHSTQAGAARHMLCIKSSEELCDVSTYNDVSDTFRVPLKQAGSMACEWTSISR
jgi:hypothetical protein